ncbi:uncharacterized protein LOC135479514 [Liolophura sinensis]|uniref:uncharacterized protein LOC135479514 n=1 Tax=Liolophura sinensis TaxID=3198878 RepID=UPI0031589861
MGLCFVETLITATLGYKATFIVSCVVTSLSCLLYSLLTVYSDFASENPVLVYITQLFLSCANWIASLAIIRFNIQLFPRAHTGKLIAVIWSMYCLAKIFFAGSMNFFFRDNFPAFFLTIAIASTVLFVPCFLLLHKFITISKEQSILEWARNDSKTGYQAMDKKESVPKEQVEHFTSPRTVLRSRYFHFMFWSSVAFYSCALSCMNNITIMAHSAKVANPLTTVYLLSVSILIPRFSFGFIFDKFRFELCGFLLLAICYFSLAAAVGIGMVWFTVHSVYLMTVFIGIAVGPSSTIAIAMLVFRFGRSHISVLSSSFYFCLAMSQLLLQLLIGFIYDNKAFSRKRTNDSCEGKSCFFWSFFTMLVIIVICIAIQVVNYFWVIYLAEKKTENSAVENSDEDEENKMLLCDKQNGM